MLKGVAAILGFAAGVLLLLSFAIAGYHVVHWLKFGSIGDVVTTRVVLSLLFSAGFSLRTGWVGLQIIGDAVLDASAAYSALALGVFSAWAAISLGKHGLDRELAAWRRPPHWY